MTVQNKVILQKILKKSTAKKLKRTKKKTTICLNRHAKIYTPLKGVLFSSYTKQLRDFQCHFNFLHCEMK